MRRLIRRQQWMLPVLVIGAVCLVFAGSAFAGRVMLPAGTEVKLMFDARAQISSGQAIAGVPLLCELAEPVLIGGAVIVDKGAKATAVVSAVEKAGRGGKAGSITVEFTELETKGAFKLPDGAAIKLTGEVSAEGKAKKLLSYILGFGLIIKGGQGEIPIDSVYTATTVEQVLLESE